MQKRRLGPQRAPGHRHLTKVYIIHRIRRPGCGSGRDQRRRSCAECSMHVHQDLGNYVSTCNIGLGCGLGPRRERERTPGRRHTRQLTINMFEALDVNIDVETIAIM